MNMILKICILFVCVSNMAFSLESSSLEQKWNQDADKPICCYLRFIDQDDKPFANIPVEARVYLRPYGGPLHPTWKGLLHTSVDGLLTVQELHGSKLWLKPDDSITASGSTVPFQEGGMALNYTDITGLPIDEVGSADHPKIVRMWRRIGKQSLIALTGDVLVPYDGHPIMIDLADGKINDGRGDVIIDISQPLGEADLNAAESTLGSNAVRLGIFPWSCKISVPDGGFYLVNDLDFNSHVFGVFNLPLITEKKFEAHGTNNAINMKFCFSFRGGCLNGKMQLVVRSGNTNLHGNISISIIDGLVNNSKFKSLEKDPEHIVSKALVLSSHK